uniref:Uncharacterized protein n=1 Tax=Oryza brachyantha TaxID=4533 RepID=J3M3E5_ORYBR
MNVRIDSSKVVKPLYDGAAAPGTLAGGESVPLSVFDTVTYDVYMAVIYAFRPPNPPNAALEVGLAKALAVYREWAGELADGDGTEGRRPAVLLNDRGALLVEATSSPSRHGYSTFESVVGHLWRAVTAARGLGAGEPTTLRISVNGRTRMRPPVPRDYFGNLVLWAFPRSTAGELVSGPVQHAAELIHRAVARVDDAYFRSFVDFASSGAGGAERLAATADESQAVLCPDVEGDSWLGIDFYDLDFGGGGPAYFMPSYLPMEGTVFLVPSFLGDGGIDAYVSLFETHLDEFKKICYTY